MSRRIFHFSEGNAHKFWSVQLDGETQTVCWGRIGTSGQEQSKTFDSSEAAHDATERLIAAKQKKGYREISAEEAKKTEPKPTSRQKLSPQMLLPFEDAAVVSSMPPIPSSSQPVAVTLELF